MLDSSSEKLVPTCSGNDHLFEHMASRQALFAWNADMYCTGTPYS